MKDDRVVSASTLKIELNSFQQKDVDGFFRDDLVINSEVQLVSIAKAGNRLTSDVFLSSGDA